MTKQDNIRAYEKRIPLAKLTLSLMNPRQVVPDADVVELADSIWEAGLIQSLAGYEGKNGGAEILGGGRRLRALNYLAQQHSDLETIRPELANPLVSLAKDAEQAQVWANTEYVARKALQPAQEIRAYGQMDTKNTPVEKIARVFAVTEVHVRRRLALAHLPTPIIDALEAGEINLTMAACFTICDDEKHSLEVLEQVRSGHYSEYSLRNALKPDSISSTDRRAIFVGEETYLNAGGKLSRDLFEEKTLFDSPELLDELFEEKLKFAANSVRSKEGWNWVEEITRDYVCSYSMGLEKYGRVYPDEGELDEDQTVRYGELAEQAEAGDLDEACATELEALQHIIDGDFTDDQKQFAGAYVCVARDGTLTVSGGYVKPETKKAAIEAGVLPKSAQSSGSPDKPKSPISNKLADDLTRVVRGARQNAAINDPDLLLALLAYQLSHQLDWQAPLGISTSTVPNFPTTGDEGYALDERLTKPIKDDMWDKDLAKSFRAFRKKGQEFALAELVRRLAAKYQGGNEQLLAMIDKETKPDIRAAWTPTEKNFFGRVGGPYMIELWADLLELKMDHPTVTTFAKLKKFEKAQKLEKLFGDPEMRSALGFTKSQITRVDQWLPEGME